jgi:hypothetical protein
MWYTIKLRELTAWLWEGDGGDLVVDKEWLAGDELELVAELKLSLTLEFNLDLFDLSLLEINDLVWVKKLVFWLLLVAIFAEMALETLNSSPIT